LRLASLSMNSTPRRHLAIANSGKLPVQAPTKFEPVINVKTAKRRMARKRTVPN